MNKIIIIAIGLLYITTIRATTFVHLTAINATDVARDYPEILTYDKQHWNMTWYGLTYNLIDGKNISLIFAPGGSGKGPNWPGIWSCGNSWTGSKTDNKTHTQVDLWHFCEYEKPCSADSRHHFSIVTPIRNLV